MHKRFSRGFTIVEIATVVFIIGLLATITLVFFNNVQAQSRDTSRANDMATLGTLLERYYDTNGLYPSGCGTTSCNSGSSQWTYPVPNTIGTSTTLSQLSTIFNQNGVDTLDPLLTSQKPFIGSGYTISNSAHGYFYRGGQTNVSGSSNTIWLVNLTETSSSRQCTVQVTIGNATGSDTAGYVLGYYAESTQTWNIYVGKHGARPFIGSGSTAGFCQIMN